MWLRKMSNTRRCAIIYYCSDDELPPDSSIGVLLGYSNGELTSIGGRKNRQESDIDCCCREAFEETKELVNYYPYKHGLTIDTIYTFSACSYYIIKEDKEVLNDLCEKFKTTHSDRVEQNELNELILFNLDNLVHMLLHDKIAYKEELKEFVLTILYGLLKPRINRCVLVSEVKDEVQLSVRLNELPLTVDIIRSTEITPNTKVYGRIIDKDMYLVKPFLR